MSGQRWDESHIGELKERCARKQTYHEIAAAMGRTPAAVQLKAGRLGISNGILLGGSTGCAPKKVARLDSPVNIGTAAEHLVCADLLLRGHRAMMAPAASPYDIVFDLGGRMLRLGVKAALRPTTRPDRENGRVCYQFQVSRNRNKTGNAIHYSRLEIDLFALVALDIWEVIYFCPGPDKFLTSFHVDGPEAPILSGTSRKHWSQYSLENALVGI